MTTENKNKLISGAGTALFMAIIVLVCLSFGYDPPDPPIPEEGVEVNIGNSDMGFGNNPMPEASEPSSAPRPVSATEQVSTQNTESTVPLYTSPKPSTAKQDNSTPTTTKPETPKEPEINKNALFTGRRNQQSGSGSQGVTEGTGDQGKPNGNPNSNNYTGNGGGNGMNYSLAGRSNVTLPRPNYSSNEQGTVVIQIWVDRDGKVTRAEYQPKGSSTSNGYLVSQARAAALRARFNADPNAPDEQKGTITYIFKI